LNDAAANLYDPTVWSNMDYLVQQAAQRHIFVEIDMSTFANHLKNQGINPYNPNLWTQFIQFVTTRYKDASNVSNYSLEGEVNPVNATSGFKATAQGYIDFFNGVTTQTYIGDGGHHLIAAGGLSFLNQPSYGIPWQQIFGLPHVDMATIHTYPSDPNNPETTDSDLNVTTPNVGAWARQNNKPFEIEEYGFIQGIGDARRAAMIQKEQDIARSNGATGLILWNPGPEMLGGTHYDVNPNYPLSWQQVVNGASIAVNPVAPSNTPTAAPSNTPTAAPSNTPTAAPSNTPTAAPSNTPVASCLSRWTCADIGAPNLAGDQASSGGSWTVRGAGGDIWGTADQFHFVWQALTGNGNMHARVTNQTNTSSWAKAGVMLRGSFDRRAPYYFAFVTPGHGISVQFRATFGASATQAINRAGITPAYLEVLRAGNTYTAFVSTDGVQWTAVAGSSVTLNLPTTLLAGLAVTSHNVTASSTANFDHVGGALTS